MDLYSPKWEYLETISQYLAESLCFRDATVVHNKIIEFGHYCTVVFEKRESSLERRDIFKCVSY